MINYIYPIIILILGIPFGYLLAYLCKDELLGGRKWFKLLALISALMTVLFIFFNKIISFTLLFISIVSLVSLVKSYDKKFVE